MYCTSGPLPLSGKGPDNNLRTSTASKSSLCSNFGKTERNELACLSRHDRRSSTSPNLQLWQIRAQVTALMQGTITASAFVRHMNNQLMQQMAQFLHGVMPSVRWALLKGQDSDLVPPPEVLERVLHVMPGPGPTSVTSTVANGSDDSQLVAVKLNLIRNCSNIDPSGPSISQTNKFQSSLAIHTVTSTTEVNEAIISANATDDKISETSKSSENCQVTTAVVGSIS